MLPVLAFFKLLTSWRNVPGLEETSFRFFFQFLSTSQFLNKITFVFIMIIISNGILLFGKYYNSVMCYNICIIILIDIKKALSLFLVVWLTWQQTKTYTDVIEYWPIISTKEHITYFLHSNLVSPINFLVFCKSVTNMSITYNIYKTFVRVLGGLDFVFK